MNLAALLWRQVELFSIGFHACQRAGIQKDDTVAIWGAGKVGQAMEAFQLLENEPENYLKILIKLSD